MCCPSMNCMLAKHELAVDMSKIGYLGNILELVANTCDARKN